MQSTNLCKGIALICTLIFGVNSTALDAQAQSIQVRVDITNNAPDGGVALTPVWVGFHTGSFDSYNGGLTAQPGLESIAEDGSTSLISTQFLDINPMNPAAGGYTYVDNSGMSPVDALVRTGDPLDVNRVDGALGSPSGPPPLEPGESSSQTFTLLTDDSHRYFSYVSMVLPSNDFFVANGNPLAHSLASLYDGEGSISFNIGGNNASPVNDAGTEAESYITSAGNGLFGLSGGQMDPDTPAGSIGQTIANVNGALSLDALNFVEGSQPNFDFNNASLYPNGIATITITAVPEPASVALASLAFASCGLVRRRR